MPARWWITAEDLVPSHSILWAFLCNVVTEISAPLIRLIQVWTCVNSRPFFIFASGLERKLFWWWWWRCSWDLGLVLWVPMGDFSTSVNVIHPFLLRCVKSTHEQGLFLLVSRSDACCHLHAGWAGGLSGGLAKRKRDVICHLLHCQIILILE